MKVKFLGAAQNVTGSKFLLETEKSRLLIDCGLYQEREFRYRDWEDLPVSPASIDEVVLTHAHIDHCGYLPKLVKNGFKGRIFCTHPTAEIAEIALLDSAKLQEDDAEFKRKRHEHEGKKGPYPEVPLYTIADARKVFPLFETISYHEEFQVMPDVKAVFYDAGHILGATMLELKINENGKEKICVFSGDLGRWNNPILPDPEIINKADYVFMESTYGNRLHEDQETAIEKLCRIITDTQEAGGNVIIPSFAIERAQELLYYLYKLIQADRIPHLMIFLDSPMAIDVTEVFKKYSDYFSPETRNLIEDGQSPFDFPLLKITRLTEESKAINHLKGTSIIIAGSGMCTGGRIKHHLANNITRAENTILFIGYQAEGTLGREILERPKKVRIFGKIHPVQARIEKINGFSAHADKNELLKWVSNFTGTPEKIFVIHGEKKVVADFASFLSERLKSEIIIPEYLNEYNL